VSPPALKKVTHHPDGVLWPRQHPGGSAALPVVILEVQMQEVRLASLQALQCCLGRPHSDLALIAFLRYGAEVLVSVEYECLWPRLSERLAHGAAAEGVRSEFFFYHMIHDRLQSDIGAEQLLGGLTHSQEQARHMAELISCKEALQIAISQVERAWELKDRFHRQFLPLPAPSHLPGGGRCSS
jgi:hypothetical protein